MAKWNITTDQLTIIPSVKVSSSSDFMSLEAARLVVISTKFSHRPLSFSVDGDDEAMGVLLWTADSLDLDPT